MLLGIAPLNSKLGEFTSSKIDPIRWTLGTAQKWDMFHSIPTLSGLKISNKNFWELKFDDFKLNNYDPHPMIRFEVAV